MTPTASLSVPHYKQELAHTCLAACVRMVLAHWGRTHSEDELRQLLALGPGGAPAARVSRVASLGFDVRPQFSNPTELFGALLAGTPPIVFLDTGSLDYWSMDCPHAAVLVGMDLTTAYLNDPYFDAAPQRTSLAGFDRAWAANRCLTAFLRPRP